MVQSATLQRYSREKSQRCRGEDVGHLIGKWHHTAVDLDDACTGDGASRRAGCAIC